MIWNNTHYYFYFFMSRIIFHCDLDCFFAAVEQRDNPKYRGKPVIIGADPKEGKGRGVISTCSYKARKFGLHSAMPISQAYRRCPHGIYLRPNINKYFKASKEVMEILRSYSNKFQQVGLDEAYIDASNMCLDFNEAKKIAKNIKQEVFDKVGITISIGVAPTKSLAKIASDYKKPNGITIVTQKDIRSFLENMDITRIPGIGKKSKIYYQKKGIERIGDIINTPLPKMMELFGKNGIWVWNIANGIDKREVREYNEDRKSISQERTFYTDTNDFQLILSRLEEINNKIHNIIEKKNIFFRTITLKIRFEGFLTYTRAKSLPYPIQDKKKVLEVILKIYKEFSNVNKKVRLVGIKLSNLEKNLNSRQTNLAKFANV